MIEIFKLISYKRFIRMYLVNDIEFPSEYLCPITLMPMIDPVVLVDGNSY